MTAFVGTPEPGKNNLALVRGAGTFTSDVYLDRMAHAAIVRSPIAAGPQ